MAYKKTRTKNGNTTNTTTQHSNGNVRRTQTIKQGKVTISSSQNKDGSVRRTTTQNVNGWTHRKTETYGKVSKPKSHGGTSRTRSSSGRRRGKQSEIDTAAAIVFLVIAFVCYIVMSIVEWFQNLFS